MKNNSTLTLSALTAFLLASSGAFAETEPTQVPVKIKLSDAVVARLTPEQRQDLEELLPILERRLFDWANIDSTPPESIFDRTDGQIITVSDLYKAPTSDEVARIGGTNLTAEQLNDIRQEAIFTVPSQDFPGRNHAWKVSLWIQKGRKNIEADLNIAKADALSQLIIKVPARISGDSPLNLQDGIKNIYRGLIETMGLFIGFPQVKPVYSDSEIAALVRKERDAYLRNTPSPLPGTDPVAPPNLAHLSEDSLVKVAEIMADLRRSFSRKWSEQKPKMESDILTAFKMNGVHAEDIIQATADELSEQENDLFYKTILASKKIAALHPRLGEALVNRAQTIALIKQAEQTFADNLAKELQEISAKTLAELEANHPIKSRISGWKEGKVQALISTTQETRLKEFYAALPATIRKAGFEADAALLEAELTFARDKQSEVESILAKKKVPTRRFNYSRRIWRMGRWKITQNQKGTWDLNKYETTTVSSDQFGWRWANAYERTRQAFKNGLRWIWAENFINGPFGLKAQFFGKPFAASYTFDHQTGEIKLDSSDLQSTYASRMRNLFKARKDLLTEHESRTDYGLLGKSGARFLLFFKADLVYGFLAPLAVGVSQPSLTLLNTVFTLTSTATSLVWAPASSLLVMGTNALIYDTEYSGDEERGHPLFNGTRGLPLLHRTLIQPGIKGVAQSVGSLLAAGVFHPVAGASQYLAGLVKAGTRSAWDSMWFRFIKNNGKVPKSDEWTWRRTSGPGLSADYYFQVNPDLVTVSLWASFEEEILNRYILKQKSLIEEPIQNFQRSVTDVLSVALGSLSISNQGGVLSQLEKTKSVNLNQLTKTVKPLQAQYDALKSRHEWRNGFVKLTEGDLEIALQKGAKLAEKFFEGAFKSMSPSEITEFWRSKDLSRSDWTGLANHYYRNIFGAEFLRPLEETDTRLKLKIENPSLLTKIAKTLEEGVIPEDLVATPTLKPIVLDAATIRSKVPTVSGEDLCNRSLLAAMGTRRSR